VRSIAELDSIIGDLDIVILIVPLTEETRNLMDEKRIAAMKSGALLVNVARGPVVNTQALVQALNSGHIKAVVDVTDPEPLPEQHPLWRAPNIIISPHVGGDSAAFEPHGRALVEAQCQRLSKGQALINEITW
jgi:phosphoglycerate dehydrogenase-like enzyme